MFISEISFSRVFVLSSTGTIILILSYITI